MLIFSQFQPPWSSSECNGNEDYSVSVALSKATCSLVTSIVSYSHELPLPLFFVKGSPTLSGWLVMATATAVSELAWDKSLARPFS